MKRPQTLKSRIIFYFCGYLTLLLIVNLIALSGMLTLSEDLAFNRQLKEIADRIVQHVEDNGELPDFLPMHITAYTSISGIPSHLQKFVTDHKPGIFEVNAENIDYHIAIVSISSRKQTIYIFYDVASIESTEQFQSYVSLALAGVGLAVICMGWLLARSISNRILNPISKLVEEVQSLSLDKDTVVLHSYKTKDEVGTLVETINQLLKRISEFTRREREFTSHASHELRTPATIIKGAVEILKRRADEEDKGIQLPLTRIEHAGEDIEMLIDTFLLLARKDQKPNEDETCDLQTIVKKVVASYQYMLETKPVEVEIQTAEDGLLQAPASLVTIALGNLVRNAFKYTMKGKIQIIAHADRVCVCDSGPGFDISRKNSGLGLTIVERLCERMNWQFFISSDVGKGTRVNLVFVTQGNEDCLNEGDKILS